MDRLKKLVNLDIGPTVEYLKNKNYFINQQPCFHDHELINKEKLIINEIVAATLGENIVAFRGDYYPTICTCTNEDPSICSNWCTRIGGYATVACAFIPNRIAQAAALFALVEFQVECTRCCENGLGHENCCRLMKKLIHNALNQTEMDGI